MSSPFRHDRPSDFRLDSEFVYQTSPVGITPGLAVKPLRKVVAKFPIMWEKAPDYFLTYFIETLSCGHQLFTYDAEDSPQKRRCEDCPLLAKRKPVQSVPSPDPKRKKAA